LLPLKNGRPNIVQPNVAVEADVAMPINGSAALIARYGGAAPSFYAATLFREGNDPQDNRPRYDAEVRKFSWNGSGWTVTDPANISLGLFKPAISGTTHHLRFEVYDSNGSATLTFYVDGQKIGTGTDSSPLEGGQMGIRGRIGNIDSPVVPTTFDNFAVAGYTNGLTYPDPEQVDFSDDFARAGNLGQSLWRIVPNNGGSFTVAPGQVTVAGPAGNGGGNALIVGFSPTDVAVQADVLPSNNLGQAGYLMARYRGTTYNGPDEQYYAAGLYRYNGADSVYLLKKLLNGSTTQLLNVSLPLSRTGARTLRFEVTNAGASVLLRVYVDGLLAVSAQDSTSPITGGGQVGISSFATGLQFANFRAYALTQPVTAPFSDTFTAPDGTALDTYSWVGTSGQFQIQGGQAVAQANPNAVPAITTLYGVAQVNVSAEADVTVTPGGAVGLLARYSGVHPPPNYGTDTESYYEALLTLDNSVAPAAYRLDLLRVSGTTTTHLLTSPLVVGTLGSPPARRLRLEVYGGTAPGTATTLLVYLGGVLAAAAPDTNPLTAAGTVGVYAQAAGDAFDNFTYSTPNAYAFDNFDGPGTTLDPSGWNVTQNGGQPTVTRANNQAVIAANGGMATLTTPPVTDAVVEADVTLPGNNASATLLARYTDGNHSYYAAKLERESDGTDFGYVGTVSGSGSWLNYGWGPVPLFPNLSPGAFHLRFEILGTALEFYVDGVLVASWQDSSVASGTVGITGTAGATFDNFLVHTLPPVLPVDHFDGSPSLSWDPQVGSFQINTAQQDIQGNTVPPAGSENVATASGVSLANVSVAANVTLSTTASMVGVVARHQASGSYYAGVLQSQTVGSTTTISAEIYRSDAGVLTLLGSPISLTGVSVGVAVPLRLEVLGNALTLFVNQQKQLTVADGALTGPGEVGLFAANGDTLSSFAVYDLGTAYDPAAGRNAATFSDTFPGSGSSLDGSKWSITAGGFTLQNGKATVSGTTAGSAVSLISPAPANVIVEADVLAPPGGQAALTAWSSTNGSGNPTGFYAAVLEQSQSGNQFWAGLESVDGSGNPTALTKLIPVPVLANPGQAHHLRFELLNSASAQNNALTLYVDGALLTWAVDPNQTFTSGPVGISGSTQATFANFQVRSFPALASESLLNWPAPAWTTQSGGFNAVTGAVQGKEVTDNVALLTNAFPSDVLLGANVTPAGDGDKVGLVARYQGAETFYAAVLQSQSGSYSASIYLYQNGVPTQLAGPQNTFTSATRLTFEVLGNSLAVYVDGSLAAWTTDGTLSGAGRSGILAASGDKVANFTAQLIGGPSDPTAGRGRPPIQDNFQQSDGSGLSPNWTWTGQTAWAISGGQAQVSQGGSSASSEAIWKTAAPAAVIVEADVRLVTAPSSGIAKAGLLARYSSVSSVESFYRGAVYLDTSDNLLHAELFKMYNGSPATLASVPITPQPVLLASTGGPRHLRLEVTDETTGTGTAVTRISLYLDGTLALTATDSSTTQRLTGTQVGIRGDVVQGSSGWGPGWSFANFQARAYDPFASDNFTRLDSLTDTSLDPAWVTQSGSFTINNVPQAVGSSPPNPGPYNLATLSGAATTNVSVSATVTVANSDGHRAGVVARYQQPGDYYSAALVNVGGSYYARIYRFLDNSETQLASSPVLMGVNGTTPVNLRFEVLGSSLALYLDAGVTACVATNDDQISGPGGVGIYSSADDPIGNFMAQFIGGPSATRPTRTAVRFRDGFEFPDGTLLSNVAGWAVHDSTTITVGGGRATVQYGDTNGFALAVVKNPTFLGDVVVSADVLGPSNASQPANVGLVARYSGTAETNDSYYRAAVFHDQNSSTWYAQFDKKVGGSFVSSFNGATDITSLVNSTPGPISLRFEVIGTTLTLYVNGTEALTATDTGANLLLDGQVGIYGTIGCSVDNFQVSSVDPTVSGGSGPSGMLAPAWTTRSGSFTASGRRARGSSAQQNLATLSRQRLRDASASATVRVSNTAGHQAGLVLRYQNANNYLAAEIVFNSSDGKYYAYIYQYQNGTQTTLASMALTGISAGSAVSLRFEAVGKHVMFSVNGVVEKGATTLTGLGEVGMLAYNDSTVDDFSASSL
jgi:hypothetical protein